MDELFPIEPIRGDVVAHAQVALERGLDQTLTYGVPLEMREKIAVGQRVKVPLGRGNTPAYGLVVSVGEAAASKYKIKPIIEIADERALLDGNLLELSRWMSRYYCCPLGIVMESLVPSAVRRRVGLDYITVVKPAVSPEEIQSLLETMHSKKRRAILARVLQIPAGGEEEITVVASHAGCKPPAIRQLMKMGVVTIEKRPDYTPEFVDHPFTPVAPIPFNADQKKAFDDLSSRLDTGFSVNLLLGVTGSGKTEVYLQLLDQVVKAGKQGIVMVPEIALTPQTVKRFADRFARVAVLHSGLSATQRHQFWQQIACGRANVVIGARSAVFAPLPKLGLIIVDEEHESSYKQDQAPRYNGRDVAVKRGQLLGIPVLLGSATPSLESYHRSKIGNYHLLSLPNRVRGLSLPKVELVDMKVDQRMRRGGINLISARLEAMLKTELERGHQAILLLNRRGYAGYIYCPSCTHIMQCKYCDASMTYHRSVPAKAHGGSFAQGVHTGQLHCHYCLAVNPLPGACPQCGKKLNLFGLGTQRVEEELAKKFPGVVQARADSDALNTIADYEKILDRFAKKEIQILHGTQMIAKGLDYPNVTLVGVISGDTALSLPDFRAAERTFQLITQAAGRAGRGDCPGRVILQTFLPDDPTLQAAMSQNYPLFAVGELEHRQRVSLPPYGRLARIVIRDESEEKAMQRVEELGVALRDLLKEKNGVNLKGPMPCVMSKIAGYYRMQILLSAKEPMAIQTLLTAAREKGLFGKSERIAVDVDPIMLM